MSKNQIIILIVVVIVVLGGIFAWSLMQEQKLAPGEEEEEETAEVFSLSAIVQSSDEEKGFLIVKPVGQENEIKVLISETTKLIKLEFPFDPANPPEEATFTPIQTEIELSDFAVGDNVFIKSKEDIAGRTEIGNIDFIHILP